MQQEPTIVLSFDSKLRTVSVVIGIRVGSIDEFPGTFGIAHLLEHMIFRGTVNRPSQLDLVLPFVNLGSKFNGETDRDRTMFYATGLPGDAEKLIALLIEMVKQPLFDPSKFQTEKKAVLNEFRSNKASSSSFLQNDLLIPNVLARWYPQSHNPVGDEKDIQNCTYQQLVDFYRSAYTDPSRIVIVVHGNFGSKKDEKQAAKCIRNKIMELWHAIPYQIPVMTVPEEKQRQIDLETSLLHYRDIYPPPFNPIQRRVKLSESYVAMGWLSSKMNSFESYVLLWISAYLTGDLVSSLYFQLRVKRGLVYQIASKQYSLRHTGVFFIKWQTGNVQSIPMTIDLINEELNHLKTFHNEDTLKRWKHWIIRRYYMETDHSLDLAHLYAEQMLLTGNICSLNDTIKIIQSITCKDIQTVATQIFSQPATIAMLRP